MTEQRFRYIIVIPSSIIAFSLIFIAIKLTQLVEANYFVG